MCAQTEPLFLLRDTALISERNGDATIYWSGRDTWAHLRHSRGVEVVWYLLSAVGTPTLKLYLQESIDGITWVDLAESAIDNNGAFPGLLGVGIDAASTPTGSLRIALTHRTAGAPFVRFGVQIAGPSGGSSQVEARLTLAVMACSRGGDVPIATRLVLEYGPPIWPGDGDQIGPIFSGIDVDQMTLVSVITNKGTNDLVLLKVQTATDPNGTWVDTGVSIDLTAAGTEVSAFDAVDKSVLGTWVRVVASGTQTLTQNATLDIAATVRMR